MRINSAVDDPAGLAVASRLSTDVRLFSQAARNIQDGISAVTIAQYTLASLTTITERQRELAEQAANGTFTSSQRAALNAEAAALTSEYNRILQTTTFNGISLFSDSLTSLSLQTGATGSEQVSFTVGQALGGASETSLSLSSGTIEEASLDFSGALVTRESFDIQIGTFYDMNEPGNESEWATNYSISLDGEYIDFDSNGEGGRISLTGYMTPDDIAAAIVAQFSSTEYTAELVSSNTVRFTSLSAANRTDAGITGGVGFATVTANANNSGGNNTIGNGQSFSFSSATSGDYYVYFTDTPGMNDPLPGVGTAIEVVLDFANATYADMTSAIATAIGAADPTLIVSSGGVFGELLTITQGEVGAVSDVNVGGMYLGSVAVSTTQQGTDGAITVPNTFGYLSHGLTTGTAIRLDSSTGAPPAALTVGNTYYAIRIDDNNFRLATSYVNAMSGTPIAFFDIGTGTQNFVYTGGTSMLASSINLTTQEGARTALTTLESRSTNLQLEVGRQGAFLNRLSFAYNSVLARRENSQAAYSRIVDADVAMESASLVKNQILQRTASAVLAQANQESELALLLLQNV